MRQIYVLFLMALFVSPPALAAVDDTKICAIEVAKQEKLQGIPDRLLHAISMVESGRWDPKLREKYAWPWTVMAEGRGRFLPNKAAAIAEVNGLKARGIRNIDVGCMQINLAAHPNAFPSIEDAFDPSTNVAYAARFLTGLYADAGDWAVAGTYYHSQTPHLAARYRTKLMAAWMGEDAAPPNANALRFASANHRPPLGLLMRPGTVTVDPRIARLRAREQLEAKTAAERAEAKRIADAYRQTKLEEYRQRRAAQQQQDKL